MKLQFKKGDKVRITNPGKTYSTYSDGFWELGFKNPYGNGSFPQGSECVVFGITSHPGSKLTLLGVRDKDGNESLISEDGVVLISSHTSLENEFDIIWEFCREMGMDITPSDVFKYLLRKIEKK